MDAADLAEPVRDDMIVKSACADPLP